MEKESTLIPRSFIGPLIVLGALAAAVTDVISNPEVLGRPSIILEHPRTWLLYLLMALGGIKAHHTLTSGEPLAPSQQSARFRSTELVAWGALVIAFALVLLAGGPGKLN